MSDQNEEPSQFTAKFHIAMLATAWGPKFGGINSFNTDLAIGFASRMVRMGPEYNGKVYCIIPRPSQLDVDQAAASGVTIIPISGNYDATLNWKAEVQSWLTSHAGVEIDWVAGHDIITGTFAIELTSLLGSGVRCAAIHHMSYKDYQIVKGGIGEDAIQKYTQQSDLFNNPAISAIFGVGPLLTRACRELVLLSGDHKQVVELLPGFPKDPQKNSSPDSHLVALTFGRMARDDDRIKQGQLAVAAFARGIGKERKRMASNLSPGAGPVIAALDPGKAKLTLMGLSQDLEARKKEETMVRNLAQKHAGGFCLVTAVAFQEDRAKLFKTLCTSNLSMMLSYHEGFGLSGWEAIATETPLIISVNSGLYQLIRIRLGGRGTGCVKAIRVAGCIEGGDSDRLGLNFSTKDCEQVAAAIQEIACDLKSAKRDARSLKRMLKEEWGCSWEDTADTMLDHLTAIMRPYQGPFNASGFQIVSSSEIDYDGWLPSRRRMNFNSQGEQIFQTGFQPVEFEGIKEALVASTQEVPVSREPDYSTLGALLAAKPDAMKLDVGNYLLWLADLFSASVQTGNQEIIQASESMLKGVEELGEKEGEKLTSEPASILSDLFQSWLTSTADELRSRPEIATAEPLQRNY